MHINYQSMRRKSRRRSGLAGTAENRVALENEAGPVTYSKYLHVNNEIFHRPHPAR